jgi:succinate dehydrogenase/fumarate reductase flavoprotein subunit
MCRDALDREESCGGHFREEHQTDEGEAKRDDENFATCRPGSTRATRPNPPSTRSS